MAREPGGYYLHVRINGKTKDFYAYQYGAMTSPALAIRCGGETYYISLSEGTVSGCLHVRWNGKTYYADGT